MNKLPEDPIKYLRLADFSGGRNTTITPALLNANESPTAKRMSFDQKGTIRPGWGRVSRYDEPFSDQPVSGLGEYRKNDGRTWLMIGAGDKIYYDRPSMTWKWEGDALPDDMLKPPGDPTFTRSSVAYKTDGTQVSANVPRFEDGKFGKAVMVEEETTNLVPNSEAFDATSWAKEGFVGSITPNAATSPWGTLTADQINITGGYVYRRMTLTAGRTYTFSCWVKSATGANISNGGLVIWCYNGAAGSKLRVRSTVTITPSWQRLSISYTAAADETDFSFIVAEASIVLPYNVYVWGAQVEEKPYATSYIPTSGATATRSPETLTIPTAGVLNPQEGTIEFWWCPINQPASTMTGSQTVAPPIIQVGNYYQNNSWLLWCGMGSQLELLVRGDNATGWTGQWTIIPNLSWYQLNRWYHIVVRWENANTFWVFIDGVKYGPYVSSQPFTGIAGNIMSLGRLNASSGPSNALYDDLRISSIARSDDEIQIEA